MAPHSIWCECDACWRQLYPPLRSNDAQIRLLEIDHQGQGSLRAYDLSSAPSYTALSYAWREISDKYAKATPGNFLINGKRRNLPHNLWSFLDNHQRFGGPKHLWVDSLCIDQKSLPELNQQVALMKEIYTSAELVMVWLGEDDVKIRPLFVALGREDSAFSKQGPGQKEYDPFTSWDLVDAMHELFKRNYWTRTWIVQEFILASNLIVCCGGLAIGETVLHDMCCTPDPEFNDADTLKAAAFLQAEPRFKDSPAVELLLSREQRQKDILKHGRHSNAVKMYIESFFPRVAAGRYCSDPRDRVYAILGLVSDEDIKADYKSSLEEVFLRTVGRSSVRNTARFGRNAYRILNPNPNVFLTNALRTEPSPPILTRIYYNNTANTTRYDMWDRGQSDVQVLAFCGCDGFHRRNMKTHMPNSEIISPGGSVVSPSCNTEIPSWYCITSNRVQHSDLAYWYPESSLVLFVRHPSGNHRGDDHRYSSGYIDLGFVAHDSKIESHLRLNRKWNYSFLRFADEARQAFAATEVRFKSMRDTNANAGWSLEANLSPAALMFLLSRADTCPMDQKEKMSTCIERWGSYGLKADVFRHHRPLADQSGPLLRTYSSDPFHRLQNAMERTRISTDSSINSNHRGSDTPPMAASLYRQDSDNLRNYNNSNNIHHRASDTPRVPASLYRQNSDNVRANSYPINTSNNHHHVSETTPPVSARLYREDSDVFSPMQATLFPSRDSEADMSATFVPDGSFHSPMRATSYPTFEPEPDFALAHHEHAQDDGKSQTRDKSQDDVMQQMGATLFSATMSHGSSDFWDLMPTPPLPQR